VDGGATVSEESEVQGNKDSCTGFEGEGEGGETASGGGEDFEAAAGGETASSTGDGGAIVSEEGEVQGKDFEAVQGGETVSSAGEEFEGEAEGGDTVSEGGKFEGEDTRRGETVSDEEFLRSWSVWRGKPSKLRRMLQFHKDCQAKWGDLPPTQLQQGLTYETPARPRPRPRPVRLASLLGRDEEVVGRKEEKGREGTEEEGSFGAGRPAPPGSSPGMRDAFSNLSFGSNPNLLRSLRPERQPGAGAADRGPVSTPSFAQSPSPSPSPFVAYCTWSLGPAGPTRLWWSVCGHCHAWGGIMPVGII
jgi:hypothetical protein